ncbi:Clp protease N-terminal domain-containing protein [Rhodococcus sp. ACS1]|uniref:Clp protease N-terminal domain-containing protein n=1 Tax=Rhodococcus sp. ACS1 TaxID=2028570 RepID=UPI00211B8F45|nr:Clp protease N-terminal domain-containing protein [Rhodococcus sp. ACS1]
MLLPNHACCDDRWNPPPRQRGTSRTPAKTKKVLEGSLHQTALPGHEEIGTDHLLLALLDDPASTGAEDPHRACIPTH